MKKIIPGTTVDWRIPLGEFYSKNFSSNEKIKFSVNEKLSSGVEEKLHLTTLAPIFINKFDLVSKNISPIPLLSLAKTQSFCLHHKDVTQCKLEIKDQKVAVQLPVLFYPKIQSVFLDGRKVDYQPTFYRNIIAVKEEKLDPIHDWLPFMLTTIIVPQGNHTIILKENGIDWANEISLLAWSLLGIFILILVANFYFRKKI